MDRIGLFFFFCGCAGISIIVWVFNWICWINQCCCCDFLHNPVNKRIAWWISFIFLLGILACCISAFVSGNRFGFAVKGSRCAIDRIYYDFKYGRLKTGRESLLTEDDQTELDKYKTFLKDNIYDYLDKLKVCQVFAMVYFCLLLIAVTFAGISMMFYACLKRQGYLITIMHVLWNTIRYFIVSFFLFGTAFGVLFLILRDSVAVIYQIFEKDGAGELDFKNLPTIESYIEKDGIDCSKTGIEDKKNCRLVKTDIHLAYRALNDASIESRKLCALSLCSAFFGAVSIYFFLLVLHHYNNELFFDQGKSIFKGFSGIAGGYKKKHSEKDPAYKKRKYRAEIELSSKNDENSNYNEVNKNENDD